MEDLSPGEILSHGRAAPFGTPIAGGLRLWENARKENEMKKKIQKLVLNRETLRGLDRHVLEQAQGGYTPRCQFSGYATCNTCEATCTTNFC